MSTDEQRTDETTDPAPQTRQGGYSVTDLPEGATPDPLGDASLSPHERATAGSDG